MKKRTHHIRIYSKTRFALFLAIIISAAFLAGGFIFSKDVSGMDVPVYETVLVQSGDTLWDIAAEYKGEDNDTRDFVKTICNVNDVSADEIKPGYTLKVPTDTV